MPLRSVILLSVLSAVCAYPARLETYTRCQAGHRYSAGPGQCYAFEESLDNEIYSPRYADAYATSEIGSSYDFSRINVTIRAGAASVNGDNGLLSAFAESGALLRTWLTAYGPVRAGWIDLDFNIYDVLDTYGGTISATIGPYEHGLYSQGVQNGRYPILLGVPFLVEVSAHTRSEAWSYPGTTYGHAFTGTGEVKFALYESDGTGTGWYELSVPEPAGTAVGGLCLLLLLYRMRRLSRHGA